MFRDKKLTAALIVYTLLFCLIWSIMQILVFAEIENALSPVPAECIKEAIKCLVWIVPAMILSRRYDSHMFIKKDEIFRFGKNWTEFIPVFIFFTVFILVNTFALNHKIAISEEFGADKIITVIFVGITEEMVFRGWLLNSTYTEKNKYTALAVNSIMFLAIHFPIWIKEGVFIANITSGGFVQIIILSLIFSWSFIKSRSIAVPVLLHMYWDFLVFLL